MLPCLLLAVALAQALPQNPSPMSDTTRPHPRVTPYDVPGRRAPLTLGTVYMAPAFDPGAQHLLLVHLHGAPWLVEHHVRERAPQAVLVTVQLGGGSGVYADGFSNPSRFRTLVIEARERVSALAGRRIEFDAIALTSFSAGYGGIRSILRHREHYDLVDALILADSLHAGYAGDATVPRTADLPVDLADLDVFNAFAADAAAGRKWLRVTHSEVYPGTYASTTETADALLTHLGAARSPVLRKGPIGMQQLSEARRGNFRLAGFAGNSAPDHVDHLYALGEMIGTLDLLENAKPSVPFLLNGQQAFEERAITLQRDPQVLRGHVVSAPPLLLERRTLGGEHLGQPLHHLLDQRVGLLDGRPRLVDEAGLDRVPPRPEPTRLVVVEEGDRGLGHGLR